MLLILVTAPILSQSYNPCEDRVLVSLQQKDSLTVAEVEIYMKLADRCADYNVEQQKLQQHADANATVKNYTTIYLGVSIVAIVVSYLIYARAINNL